MFWFAQANWELESSKSWIGQLARDVQTVTQYVPAVAVSGKAAMRSEPSSPLSMRNQGGGFNACCRLIEPFSRIWHAGIRRLVQ